MQVRILSRVFVLTIVLKEIFIMSDTFFVNNLYHFAKVNDEHWSLFYKDAQPCGDMIYADDFDVWNFTTGNSIGPKGIETIQAFIKSVPVPKSSIKINGQPVHITKSCVTTSGYSVSKKTIRRILSLMDGKIKIYDRTFVNDPISKQWKVCGLIGECGFVKTYIDGDLVFSPAQNQNVFSNETLKAISIFIEQLREDKKMLKVGDFTMDIRSGGVQVGCCFVPKATIERIWEEFGEKVGVYDRTS
jgi:hypothetical protein